MAIAARMVPAASQSVSVPTQKLVVFDQESLRKVKGLLAMSYEAWVYDARFARLDLHEVRDTTIVLSVPLEIQRRQIERHYIGEVLRCCQRVVQEVEHVELIVRGSARHSRATKPDPELHLRQSKEACTSGAGNDAEHKSKAKFRPNGPSWEALHATLPGFAGQPADAQDALSRIFLVVANRFRVSEADILSRLVTREISLARQVCMYLTQRLTPLKEDEIANQFNRKCSSVYHALSRIEDFMGDDPDFAAELKALERRLRGM